MAYIEIDIDDLVSSMSAREIQNLVDNLYVDGYAPTELEKQEEKQTPSIVEQIYLEAIGKLSKSYHRLTSEEEQMIINLANKF